MDVQNISVFCMGVAFAYFSIYSYHIYKNKENSRLMQILSYIYAYWAIMNLKDIVLTFPGCYTDKYLEVLFVADGWSAITFTIFIFELTQQGWATMRKVILLSIPFLVFTVLYITLPWRFVFITYATFLVFYGLSIVSIGFIRVRKYTDYIHDNFSDIDDIDLSWFTEIVILFVILLLLWISTSANASHITDAIYYLSSIVLWEMARIRCKKLRPILLQDSESNSEDKTTATYDNKSYHFADSMENIIVENELYLNKELELSDIVALANTNRTYMSTYFREVMHTTFYDYINKLRIEKKSVPLMKEHPDYTLEYIASASGFNSVSTFRRSFRKLYGMSPKDYRKSDK